MTDHIFPRNVVRLQEPPVVEIEGRLDGSLQIVPGSDPIARSTRTQQGTNEGTSTSHTTHTSGGTSSSTSTGTSTSGAVRVGGEARPLIQAREVLGTEILTGAQIDAAGFEFDQRDFAELRTVGGEIVRNDHGVMVNGVTLHDASARITEVLETWPGATLSGSRLPGVIAADDSDDDEDGDTDRESDDDSGDDSDNRHDSEPDEDGIARGGREIIVPFDIDRIRHLPFA